METENKPCRCNCGNTCGRKCGLEIMECIEKHYVRDCEHDFTGEYVDIGNGFSSTCAKCGMTAISHDMRVGP